MKDFDAQRKARAEADRTFQIGGEVFKMKVGVRPEALAEYEKLDTETAAADTLKVIDDLILSFMDLENGDEARYRSLREREADPLTLRDLTDLVEWLLEEQTGRTPTRQSSRSTPGARRTRTT